MNPKCTDFCTQGGSKGHREVSAEDIGYVLGQLDAMGIKAEPSMKAVDALYREGHGYPAIADALGISHEDGFKLLTGQAI